MLISDMRQAWKNAQQYLLAQRNARGYWEGELSSSALSTATAVCALRDYRKARLSVNSPAAEHLQQLCHRGLDWLADHQNDDGGWGDTVTSFSNISTTLLCLAALADGGSAYRATTERCEGWLVRQTERLDPECLVRAIRAMYGRDHTFSVPILTALALSGRLGDERSAWRRIPQLPFELAACPHKWFAALRLPVVSYALPALIAIGLVRHRRRPSRNVPWRRIRDLLTKRTLRRLRATQPESGGYLEATPLTSFVMMSLIGAELAEHAVTKQCLQFLIESVRSDGSWAIDTDLSSWVTTLGVRALREGTARQPVLQPAEADQLRKWILAQQHRFEHPYTHAAPGGWSWTDRSGGVPDADDTSSALLALKALDDDSQTVREAAALGVIWLVELQNRDGGIPTFCRGWGTLPFDQSSADVTAHALRAWRAWETSLVPSQRMRVRKSRQKALQFLLRHQQSDGSWLPLWFGNQHARDESNRTYGTSRVLLALAGETQEGKLAATDAILRGAEWLLAAQNPDGGWSGGAGCPSSIEETALALESLVALAECEVHREKNDPIPKSLQERLNAASWRGVDYLITATEGGRQFPASPIGLYFAKLWYCEALYPVIFSVAALGRLVAYHEATHSLCRPDEVGP